MLLSHVKVFQFLSSKLLSSTLKSFLSTLHIVEPCNDLLTLNWGRASLA